MIEEGSHFWSHLIPNFAIVNPNISPRDIKPVCVECSQVYDIMIVLQG